MIHNTYPIQAEGSLPDTKLVTYIQEDSESIGISTRPLILVCPGGAYAYTSDREAEVLALQFLAMGYHAAVLRYSCAPARFPTALVEVAKAVLLIRENAEQWKVDSGKIILLGCSAGGHLAASFGTLWAENFLAEKLSLSESEKEKIRPNGLILCYPVITSGEYAHRGSFENLLGEQEGSLERSRDPESLAAKLSLETRVTDKTPGTFIWHTYEDGSVPVENSLLFVSALRKARVPVEFHMYAKGGHGLSLANRQTATPDGGALQPECTTWIELVRVWLESNYISE